MRNAFNLAIIGCGRWGLNHVKTAYDLFGDLLKLVVDSDSAAQNKVEKVSKTVQFSTTIDAVLRDDTINAVIIATPALTHYDLARKLICQRKHVLVEKPITLESAHAEDLVRLALENDVKLMVGHVLLYHPAIIDLKRWIDAGKIGKLQYIYSNRLNLGSVRTEENILWSFAPHDISVMQYFVGQNPDFVDAKGARFLQDSIEDTTITYLRYPDNIHAHIFVSWLHPFKEHRLVVIGERGMLVFEDSLPNDKLKFYPKGFVRTKNGIEKFDGEYEIIPFEAKQPLAQEQLHFRDCIVSNQQPKTDGNHALEVLRILEQATERLHDEKYTE